MADITDTAAAAKRAAGYMAAGMVEDGMVIGLGTGSTVYHTIECLSGQDPGRSVGLRYSHILPDCDAGTGIRHSPDYT